MRRNSLRRRTLCLALLLLSASTSGLAADVARLAPLLPEQGEVHLGLFNGESADGFMRLGWLRDPEGLRLYDRTMMPSQEIYETMEARLALADWAPKNVRIRFHQGSAVLRIDARFENRVISGNRSVEQPGQPDRETPIAHDMEGDTLLRATAFLLPLVADTTEGAELAFPWYGPLGDALQEVTLTARETAVIDTPAGAFEAIRFELRGGSPENDIFVTREAPRRIVRIDVLGQPLRFLALPDD